MLMMLFFENFLHCLSLSPRLPNVPSLFTPCFILFYFVALWPFVSYFLRILILFLRRFSSFEPLKFVFAFVYHRWTWTCFWTVFVFALEFEFGFGFGLGVNWTGKLTEQPTLSVT